MKKVISVVLVLGLISLLSFGCGGGGGGGSATTPTGSISGTVTEQGILSKASRSSVSPRAGISSCSVSLKEGTEVIDTVLTDGSGNYIFNNVPVGTNYSIYATKEIEGETKGLFQKDISVTAGNATVLGVISLKQTGTVGGIIFSDSGNIAGARVEIIGQIDTSDATGNYQVSNIPFASHEIVITKTGYETYTVIISVGDVIKTHNVFLVPLTGAQNSIVIGAPPADGATTASSYKIEFAAYDPDSNADVSLYYDTNNSGHDGTLIESGLKENTDTSYTWDVSSIPDGNYYIYAKMEDGQNPAIYAYSLGYLSIVANHSPTISLTKPDGGESWFGNKNILWTATDEDGDELSIDIFYSDDGGSNWYSIVADTSNDGSYTWDTSTVTGGSNYRVKVIADDGEATAEDISNSSFSIVSQGGVTLSLQSGSTLNSTSISLTEPELTVAPGASINGTINLSVVNNYSAGAIVPLGWTSSWGTHSTSYVENVSDVPTGTSSSGISISDVTAPSTPGVYYMIFASAGRVGLDYVMSRTSDPTVGSPSWDDNFDIADLTDTEMAIALDDGFVVIPDLGQSGYYNASYGLAFVKVIVELESGTKILLQDNSVLNGTDISLTDPKITIAPSASITGTVKIKVVNNYSAGALVPVGYTPSWGTHSSSYECITTDVNTGTTYHDVPIDLTAPSAAGIYYLTFASTGRVSCAYIMSRTSDPSVGDPSWDDDYDIADLTETEMSDVPSTGFKTISELGQDGHYDATYGLAYIKIKVFGTNNEVIKTIAVGDVPHDIAAEPAGNYVYVANANDDTVSVIQVSSNTVIKTINVGDFPSAVAAEPGGDYVYVVNSGSDSVSVIQVSSNTVYKTINVGDGPRGVGAEPGGDYVYVANGGDDNVSVIQVSDNTVIKTVAVTLTPLAVGSEPGGDYVYVTNENGYISVIQVSDNTVVKTITQGTWPHGVAAEPTGNYVYIPDANGDYVSVIQVSNNTVTETLDVGNYPYDVAVEPDGDYLYVTNTYDDTVSVIQISNHTVIKTIDVGNHPHCVAAEPSGNYVYVSNGKGDSVSVIEIHP